MSTIYISKKEELYTYDELEFIKGLTVAESSETTEVLNKLLKALEGKNDSMAVFFMPQETFQILSMFQGDNSVCDIDLTILSKIKDIISCEKTNKNQDFIIHLSKKIDILYNYLHEKHSVKPVIVPSDNLMTFNLI